MTHPFESTRRGLPSLFLLLGLAVAAVSAAGAQSGLGPATVEGVPMMLPDGRLAIFGPRGQKVVVLRIASAGADRTTLDDLREGDIVVGFQGVADPDMAGFKAALAGTATGVTLHFTVRRDGVTHEVRIPKPGSSFIVPKGAGARQERTATEGWTRSPDPGRAAEPNRDSQVRTFQLTRDEQAAEPTGSPASGVEQLLAAVTTPDGPGVSVAVLHRGRIVSAARGLASLETTTPLSAHTVLPVASVAKQFTAFAIALLVDRGALSLEADVRSLIPELSELGERVTVRQLLTHTSGLKDYTGLLALTGWEYGDRFTAEQLLTLVSRQRELQFRPGSQHRYSNTNYALLPIIIERIVGMSFHAWTQREVFAPLGMGATSFPDSPGEVIPASAELYQPVAGGFERAHGGHELAGAGGMLSTSLDLLQWSRELTTGVVGGEAVMAMMREPTVLDDGTEIGYGLGVGVDDFRGVPRLAHSGTGPGSASVLHVYPDDDLSIAVLANYGGAEVYKLAERIAELYLADRLASESKQTRGFGQPGAFMITDEHISGEGAEPGVAIDAGQIAAFAGRYVLEEDERELMLEAEGSTLRLKLAHSVPGVPLVHLGDSRFRFPPAGWELSFDPTTRPAQRIVLHLVEGSIHRGEARDVTGHRADVPALTRADLERFVGRFASPELGVVYRIFLDGDALVLEHPRIGRLPLTHHSGDDFGLPGKQVRRVSFLRRNPDDPTSKVTGFIAEAYAWAANARFERLDP